MRLTPRELQQRVQGLLGFPMTPFTKDDRIDVDVFRNQVRLLLDHGAGAIFPACGTGEFFSLTAAEYRQVVRACVEEVGGAVPVIPGTGYGTAMAIELAQAAAEEGADGLLAMPPYLVVADQAGLEAHYRALGEATRLGVVLYQRDNAVFQPETVRRLSEVDTIIGLKDGIGQLERLQLIRDQVDPPFLFMNGMPTAEIHAMAFASVGVNIYSSAILNFLPEASAAFYAAVTAGETTVVDDLLHRVIWPLTRIRNRRQGYAVSMVKAGARLRGLPVGHVRPPLVELTEADESDLAALLAELRLDSLLAAHYEPKSPQ